MKNYLLIFTFLSCLNPGFSAPLDPPQIFIVPTYIYPSGDLFVGTGIFASSWKGTSSASVSSLYPFTSVPEDGSLVLTMYARSDTSHPWGNSIASKTISSWGPTLGIRWTAAFPDVTPRPAHVDRLPHLSGRNVQGVYNALGYGGVAVEANSTVMSSRMDWENNFIVAVDHGPAANGAPIVDPVLDYVVFERTWRPYDTTTWELSPTETALPVEGSNTFTSILAGNSIGPVVWNNPASLYSGPAGSDVRTVAGRERITARIQPFSGNPLGLPIADFYLDCWPQTTGALVMPAKALQIDTYVVDGSDSWALAVNVENVFPGATVYAEISGVSPTVFATERVPFFGVGPTLPASFPTTFSDVIPQSKMVPAISEPDGTYRVRLLQEYNGVIEELDSVDYAVRLSLKVRSNITELSK